MTRRCVVASPIGWLLLEAGDAGLGGITLLDAPPADHGAADSDPVLAAATAQLEAYLAGELLDFELPLAAAGTPFQRRVWDLLRAIPYGTTTTYGALAARLGQPAASRAVGLANGRNPLPIVVPCHRVIGADGSLTGYGSGLWRKRWLLAHEQAVMARRETRLL